MSLRLSIPVSVRARQRLEVTVVDTAEISSQWRIFKHITNTSKKSNASSNYSWSHLFKDTKRRCDCYAKETDVESQEQAWQTWNTPLWNPRRTVVCSRSTQLHSTRSTSICIILLTRSISKKKNLKTDMYCSPVLSSAKLLENGIIEQPSSL